MILSSCKEEEDVILSQEINDWEFEYEGGWHKAIVPGNNFSDFNHKLKNIKLVKRNYDHNFWEKIKEKDIADGLILTSIHTCDKTNQKSEESTIEQNSA